MAGGIGSRFWPYSRNDNPKQFLDFFGTGRSLLQMTVDRFRSLVPIEHVLIVTNIRYRDTILKQIPDIRPTQVICEPARRNTAPCVAYAVSHIKAMVRREKGLTNVIDMDDDRLNANIIVAPSDHLIMQEGKFLITIKKGLDYITSHNDLLTLGMRPTRPETGYGYIQVETISDENTLPQLQENTIYKVKTFTEKPNRDLAEVFLKSGEFLWNSGIFLWNLKAITAANRKFLPILKDIFLPGEPIMATDKEEAFIQNAFPKCPNISLDYGIMEKADNVYVLPADFGWSDLGTWGSLYDLSKKDESNNVTLHADAMYYESEGNIVALPKGHLAVIEGLQDMIIAENEQVLLICRKNNEQLIRQFVSDADVRFDGQFS